MAMSGNGNEASTVAEVVLERKEMEERDCIVEKGKRKMVGKTRICSLSTDCLSVSWILCW